MEENLRKSIMEKRTTLQAFNATFRGAGGFEACPITDGSYDIAAQLLADCYVDAVRGRGGEIRPAQLPKEAVRFAAGIGKPWLLLTGEPGTGKTTIMAALERLSKCGRPGDEQAKVKWVKGSAMGGMLKNAPQEWEEVKSARLLYVDDIGFAGECELVNNYGVTSFPFVELVEARYDGRLATVISTNLTPAEVASKYKRKIADRLFELCAVVVMNGTNYRRP